MSAEPSLGAYLRQCRERSGLSVGAISTGSRIVPHLVEALETDRQDLLPAPVYVRGFVRAYCEQVGIDAEPALRLYAAQAAPRAPVTDRTASPVPREPAYAWPWRHLAAVSLLVVGLGAGVLLLLMRRHPDAVADRGGDVPRAAPGAATVAVPPTTSPARQAAVAAQPVERVLLARVIDTTWIRIQPDGAAPTEETLSPGAVREWRSAGRFHVTLGNAGGVELELDGRRLPALGAPGEVVRDATVPGEPRP
jgi:cytoskeleton protein RodZ